jgi:DNA-binding XRE family transcriptional regulator
MDENLPNPLPALLKHFRKKAGYTQTDIAKAISVSRSGYANYEEGRCLPDIEQTIKLSELLNHDLLYAYTLSTRHARANNNISNNPLPDSKSGCKTPQSVMETGTYITAFQTSENASLMLDNYKTLHLDDQKLVNNFVEMLSKKEK